MGPIEVGLNGGRVIIPGGGGGGVSATDLGFVVFVRKPFRIQ